jgi:hypothetical protein
MPYLISSRPMAALSRSASLLSAGPRLLQVAGPARGGQARKLNLLEYQSKGLLENYGVTVQKFKMASNPQEVERRNGAQWQLTVCQAAAILSAFPCQEYVIKAQVSHVDTTFGSKANQIVD